MRPMRPTTCDLPSRTSDLPANLRPGVDEVAVGLVDQVNCPPPPAPPEEKKKPDDHKDHHEGDQQGGHHGPTPPGHGGKVPPGQAKLKGEAE